MQGSQQPEWAQQTSADTPDRYNTAPAAPQDPNLTAHPPQHTGAPPVYASSPGFKPGYPQGAPPPPQQSVYGHQAAMAQQLGVQPDVPLATDAKSVYKAQMAQVRVYPITCLG